MTSHLRIPTSAVAALAKASVGGANARLPRIPRRNPAIAAAVSFAAGIALDRLFPIPLSLWLVCGVVIAALWAVCLLRPWNLGAAMLLAALGICAGGARHHDAWSVQAADDLSLYATDEPQLVHFSGTIAEEPRIRLRQKDPWRSAWVRSDFSLALVRCRSLQTSRGPIAISGCAQLQVTGHLLHVAAGDDVEIHGWLMHPTPPSNPGEFNANEFLRREGATCIVRTDHPDAVIRLTEGERTSFGRWISQWRTEAEFLFTRHLSPRTAPLASSLILGDRGGLSREVRDAFAESGMMHVLAISGQNVGILAALFWLVCRLFRCSERATALVIAAAAVAYALLTLGEPPIVRATVMVLLAALGRPWHRDTRLFNLLAVAALMLLAWNPADLFDVGAQLSFLAVAAIGWFASHGSMRRWIGGPIPSGREYVAGARRAGAFAEAARTLKQAILAGYGLTIAIWIFTLPLVAARFHLVSPIGLVINVLLAPVIVVVLWLGYVFAVCGLLVPPLAATLGPVFHLGLESFLELIETSAKSPLAWCHVPAIPEWWLCGYYALLAAAIGLQRRKLAARRALAGLLLWTVGGLAYGLIPAATTDLRITFLSVGHGCSVLVEAPNGRTLLYDAGAIHDADFAEHVVENALWQSHRRGIDALVISHADVDHFNGVPGLLRSVPVGSLFVSRPFVDFRQGLVRRLCDTAADRHVPIRFVHRGDCLPLDADMNIEVLHPAAGASSQDDNANSIVLQIEYAGRKVLLTGDLSDDGLQSLLGAPPRKADVLLSPHHGSLASNPTDLARWARPELVVVSNSRTTVLPELSDRYGGATEVLSTHAGGAIVVEIGQDGSMNRTTTIPHSRQIARQ